MAARKLGRHTHRSNCKRFAALLKSARAPLELVTEEERRATPTWETQDVPDEQQIVVSTIPGDG
jgi:hypothetical protein